MIILASDKTDFFCEKFNYYHYFDSPVTFHTLTQMLSDMQEPGIPSRSPMWATGPQLPEPQQLTPEVQTSLKLEPEAADGF